MTLTEKAYLEIVNPNGTDATFEFHIGLEYSSSLQKSYIMGSRGQYLREIYNQTLGEGSFSSKRRTGYWLDGGAGDWQPQVSFRTGLEDVVWGDQSGGTGPANVTETDASGADVKAISRLNVLQYWLAKSRSDSAGYTKLHHGEWTDGNIAHVTGVSAGAYDAPMPVAVQETNFTGVQPQGDDVVSFEGNIQFSKVAILDMPDWFDGVSDAIQNAAADLTDA